MRANQAKRHDSAAPAKRTHRQDYKPEPTTLPKQKKSVNGLGHHVVLAKKIAQGALACRPPSV